MGLLDGQVALITGGARGQGRSHALRLAAEGAAVVVADICEPIEPLPYPLGTKDELDETVRLIVDAGGQALGVVADTRNYESMRAAVDETLVGFGRLDIVIANAGIAPMDGSDDDRLWSHALDVNLTGTYNTIRAAIPTMIEAANGGSVILVSSVLGLQGTPTDHGGALGYVASKHGVLGLMKSYANLLAPHSIRVNAILPTGLATPMVDNPGMEAYHANTGGAPTSRNALPVDLIEEVDVSHAVIYLATESGRYVTGVALPVDAGFLNS